MKAMIRGGSQMDVGVAYQARLTWFSSTTGRMTSKMKIKSHFRTFLVTDWLKYSAKPTVHPAIMYRIKPEELYILSCGKGLGLLHS